MLGIFCSLQMIPAIISKNSEFIYIGVILNAIIWGLFYFSVKVSEYL